MKILFLDDRPMHVGSKRVFIYNMYDTLRSLNYNVKLNEPIDDSFNIIINARDEHFDWFDNPYISPNVFEIDEQWKPVISDKIKLKKCSQEDLLKFMSETMISWY